MKKILNSRKVASFDIGSNSVLCTIAEVFSERKELLIISDKISVTGLGRGLSEQGLNNESKQRTLDAIKEYRQQLDNLEVAEVFAVATAAMRDAKDGQTFACEIKELFAIPVEIISGIREGELTFTAIANTSGDLLENFYSKNKEADEVSANFEQKEIAVIDIGGRSTELIFGNKKNISYKVSLPLGSISGTEGFLLTQADLVAEIGTRTTLLSNLRNYRDYISKKINEQHLPQKLPETLYGIAATATSFASMFLKLKTYDAKKIQNLELDIGDIEKILYELANSTIEERRARVGLDPKRADVIVAGGAILFSCMQKFGYGKIKISDYGLRHGVLLNKFRDYKIINP